MLRKTKWIITLLLGSVFSTYLHAETVWVDVRSVAEHQVDSIDGDLRISHPQIVTEIAKLYIPKQLEDAGFSEFDGGCDRGVPL